MPTATLPLYRRRSVEHPALSGFDLRHFAEGLRKLYGGLREGLDGARHTSEYVRLVLEVANKKPKPEADPKAAIPAKDFATYFLERTPGYSTTKAGLSALLFETWLAEHGGELFGLFLETVLTSDSEYLAIFTGELTTADLDRLRDKVSDFATFEVAVRMGDRDYKRGVIADVTMLACKANKSVTDPAKDAEKDTPEIKQSPKIETLLPQTRDGYERVLAEGGLSASAVPIVFGSDPFAKAHFERGLLAIEDPNGVLWLSEDDGRHWNPDPTTLRDPSPVRETKRAARETKPPVRETTAEPVAPDARMCETAASGALRSRYGSWAVFEAPVEGGRATTVVVVRDRAWSVGESLATVDSALRRIEDVYAGQDPEFDLMAEAFLGEYASEVGVEVSNPSKLAVVLESTDDGTATRDRLIATACRSRLVAEGRSPTGYDRAVRRLREAFPPKKDVPPGDGEAPPQGSDGEGDGAPPPPPPPPEPEPTSDHMDDPPFYREDLQGFYDLQITTGLSPVDALARVRQRFKVKGLIVTPAGEVRAPGVIDRPKDNAPPPPPPQVAAPAPAPPKEPEIVSGGPVSGQPPPAAPPPASGSKPAAKPQEALQPLTAREEAALAAWLGEGAQGAPVALLRPWARLARRPEAEVTSAWEAARGALSAVPGPSAYHEAARLVRSAVLSESAQPDQQLNLQSVDDAFMYWLVYEDGDMEEFGEWLDRFCPHLSVALEVWQPANTPLAEGRLQALAEAHARRTKSKADVRAKRPLTVEELERYGRWKQLVNMPARSLRRFLTSESFREAISGPRAKTTDLHLAKESARRTLAMKATPVEEWTGEMWNWCGRQTHFISRLRGTPAPLIEQGRVTRKYLTLKAWGHDPAVPGRIAESEVARVIESAKVRADGIRSANRLIDALPGSGPRLIESEVAETPDFDVLRRNRTKLSDEERDAVMREEAVWHHGPKGEKTPAVWKAEVDGETWFVTNTHRAFQARPTLDGAISAFHKTIRATA